MANMSTAYKNLIYDHTFRNAAWASPVNVFFALYSGDPLDDDSGPELAGNGYARVVMAMGAPVDGVGSNNGIITFAAATGDWLPATHFGIKTLVAGGIMLLHNNVTVPRTVLNGDVARVLVDGFTATFL